MCLGRNLIFDEGGKYGRFRVFTSVQVMDDRGVGRGLSSLSVPGIGAGMICLSRMIM